ncbi:MAG: hypothetical protein KGD65_06515 [Candidatus Lokiarchaeota archaeon]|nr:hypothetical protein [Candidatus Lokiarchaeota archaeon]
MCFYITATFPKGTQVGKLREILEFYQMDFSEIDNPVVKSQLRPDEKYFRATKDYCDCDTVLGSLNNLQDFQTLTKSKKVKALKKKNWSEEEINNWINEKLKTKQKNSNEKFTPTERKERIIRWVNFLHNLLDNKNVLRIGLLKHWYTGGLKDEEIKIKKTEKIAINQVTPELLLNLSEDILYEFFPIYDY